ncbi:MAG: cyclic nucleotide-binding domain-containing protein [Gammaproteobacteria bacterium]|nr:MAG: cyclic nucleotide-binding domain-containing protein [Gammaproteobacteria bacterium]
MDKLDVGLKKRLIRAQPCFSILTEQELDELEPLFIEKHIPEGEVIVNEGDFVDSVYLIVKGTADVRHVSIENNTTKIDSLATLESGGAIGLNESGFYSLSGVRTATVVAKSDMVLLRLSVAAFHGFTLMNSHVNEAMRKYARDLLGMKS